MKKMLQRLRERLKSWKLHFVSWRNYRCIRRESQLYHSSLAYKMVASGSLTSCTRGVSIKPLKG